MTTIISEVSEARDSRLQKTRERLQDLSLDLQSAITSVSTEQGYADWCRTFIKQLSHACNYTPDDLTADQKLTSEVHSSFEQFTKLVAEIERLNEAQIA